MILYQNVKVIVISLPRLSETLGIAILTSQINNFKKANYLLDFRQDKNKKKPAK